MGKALTGAVELGGAIGMGAAAFFDPALIASPLYDKVMFSLALAGIASEAGAIADALSANRGQNITTRNSAANAEIVYGEWRIGGVLIYASTTGSHKDQYNRVIALCAHPIDAVVNLYLDGRQVFWSPGSAGQQTSPSGVVFGGAADGSNHYDAGNNRYNFGSLVYAEQHLGTDAPGTYSAALHANDPAWGPTANGTPYGGDVSYIYVKVEYDNAMFPSLPEIRVTVRGKNNIADPRTGTYGYTTNWALVLADVLVNADWGLGIPQWMLNIGVPPTMTSANINVAQLIVAANICDEAVGLANGSTEPRYTFNGKFDTSSSPGDILQSMMASAGGKLTYSGGQFYIWPAAAYSVSFGFSQDDLIDGIQFSSYRSNQDLCNRVSGTFTAPNYPYTPFGNLYNANGHDPDGYSQNNFNQAWQPTTYPTYAQDVLHGYAADAWLEQDGNIEKWKTLNMPGVISIATAQRLAKIELLRNRLQRGSYSFKFKLGAWLMMPQDVFTLTFPQLSWNAKPLQVESIQLAPDYPEDGAPKLYVAVNATDYDSNVYAWQASEELSILDAPSYPLQGSYDIAEPTSMTLNSGAGIDVVAADGVLTPRIQVLWTDPQDAYVTSIETQWSGSGLNQWASAAITPVGLGYSYITGPVAGLYYDVRIRSLNGKTAVSGWLEITQYQCSATSLSSITSIGLSPGIPFNVTNDATVDSIVRPGTSNGDGIVRIYGPGGPGTPWTLYSGAGTFGVPAADMFYPYSTSGIVAGFFSTSGNYGYGNVIFGKGSLHIVYGIEQSALAFISDTGFFIGSFVTCDSTGANGVSGGGGVTGGGLNGPRPIPVGP